MHWAILFSVLPNLLCPVWTYRLTVWKFFFARTLITMIIITVIHTCAIGQIQAGFAKKWMVEFVFGVDQENVLLGQHAVQTWTPLDSYATSCGELFVPESPSPLSAGSPWDCGRWVDCYTTTACSAAHIQYEAVVRGYCCGVWWFYPLIMLWMFRIKSNVVKPSMLLT